MLLVMVSMVVARTFGFRHRAVEDEQAVFRVVDAMMGFMLWTVTVAGLSAAFQVLIPAPPDWVNNVLGALAVGVVICAGTVWMPFIEHLSLLPPEDMTARQRRGIVILARTIPYLYGLVAVGMALVLAGMMVLMFGTALMGLTQFAGFDLTRVEWGTWLWVSGGVALLLAVLLFIPSLLKQGRLMGDWGLPDWRGFVEPGERIPAGERLFRTLDATLGRLVLAVTTPSAKEREMVRPAPTQLSDLRRFPGDIADLAAALIVSGLVIWLLGTVGGAILGSVAPDLAVSINAAMNPTPAGTRQMRPAEMAVMMATIIPMLLTLFGTVAGLMWLANRSQDVTFSRHGWVRWLACGAELLRLLGLALMALLLGGIVGGLAGSAIAPDQPWVGFAIFAVAALTLGWTFLRTMPGENGALVSFVANVRAANQPEEMDPASTDAS